MANLVGADYLPKYNILDHLLPMAEGVAVLLTEPQGNWAYKYKLTLQFPISLNAPTNVCWANGNFYVCHRAGRPYILTQALPVRIDCELYWRYFDEAETSE